LGVSVAALGLMRSVRTPRSLHETSREPAARATDSARERTAEVIDEEPDLTTSPHRLDGVDTADVDPSEE